VSRRRLPRRTLIFRLPGIMWIGIDDCGARLSSPEPVDRMSISLWSIDFESTQPLGHSILPTMCAGAESCCGPVTIAVTLEWITALVTPARRVEAGDRMASPRPPTDQPLLESLGEWSVHSTRTPSAAAWTSTHSRASFHEEHL
jgi:hypothetical protein